MKIAVLGHGLFDACDGSAPCWDCEIVLLVAKQECCVVWQQVYEAIAVGNHGFRLWVSRVEFFILGYSRVESAKMMALENPNVQTTCTHTLILLLVKFLSSLTIRTLFHFVAE